MHRLTLLAVLSLTALPLSAQMDRATLTGVVMDPSRSVIAGARIDVKAVATGIDYVALANSAGAYTPTGLPVGQYTASISANGFETLTIQSFTLDVGETRALNVIVADATPDLNLTNAEVGGVINGSQTEKLPDYQSIHNRRGGIRHSAANAIYAALFFLNCARHQHFTLKEI